MKFKVFFLMLVFSFSVTSVFAQNEQTKDNSAIPQKLPDIMAKIDGEEITSEQLIVYASKQTDYEKFVEWLVYEKLIGQHLKDKKLNVKPHEVESEITKYRKLVKNEGGKTLEEHLMETRPRMTLEDLKRVISTQIGVNKLVKLEYGKNFNPEAQADQVEEWMRNLKFNADVSYQGKAVPENAIASVNGELISAKEFSKVILGKVTQNEWQNMLWEVLNKKMVRDYAEKKNITLEDKDVDIYMKIYEQGLWIRDPRLHGVDLEQFLEKSFGEPLEKFKKRERVCMDALVYKILGKEITDNEAKQYYFRNLNIYSDEQVRASHILISARDKTKGLITDKGYDDALIKIKEIKEKYDGGVAFDKLAIENSDCPSAGRGGNLGYFNRKKMVKEFADVAFKLKVGDVSGPVKTQFGYHLIKVTDKKEGTPPDEILGLLKNDMIRFLKFAKWIGDRRAEHKIEDLFSNKKPEGRPVPEKK